MKFKKFTLLFAFLLGTSMVQAQELDAYKTLSFGLDLGINKSYTDINQYPIVATYKNKADIQPSIGLHLKKTFSNVFGVQLNLGYDRLQGVLRTAGGESGNSTPITRRNRINRYLNGEGSYFQTPVVSFGLDAQINLSNLGLNYRESGHRKFIYYAVVGASGATFNPQLKYIGNDAAVGNRVSNEFEIDQSSGFTLLVRTGIGAKYHLNNKFDLGFEVVANTALTDFLDGLSIYSNGDDAYVTTRFTLTYKLPSKTAGAETDLLDWANPGHLIKTDINNINQRLDSLASLLDNSMNTADADGDGVYDAVDKEPYTPFGAKVDADGKGIDSDGDGVYDGLDKEASTPAGKLVNFQGVEIKMPALPPTTINGGGTSKVNTEEAYFPSLFFETGSARVRSMDVDKLVRVATALQQNAALKVKISGNADVRGGTEFNEGLAKRRAEAVRDYLVKNLGVDGGRISIESKGESTPLSPNMNNVNRRVDIMGTK